MNSITFTCEVVTPMFLAGADGNKPEFRPPSIKGALRFWWRAMHGNMNIEQLRNEETRIFGGGGNDAERSKVNIRVSHPNLPLQGNLPTKNISMPLRKYHDEYGEIHNVDLFKYLAYGAEKRKFIAIDIEFEITFTYNDRISVNNDILNPFYALVFFGGLGAKCRNGFGSFQIKECSDKSISLINDPAVFLRSLSPNFSFLSPCLYTAFSKDFSLFKTNNSKNTWSECLAVIGEAYAVERRKLEYVHHYDKRAYIATPIIQSKTDWHTERHAKQYFLSVTKNNNKYDGWILFLPYKHRHDTVANAYKDVTDKLNNGLLTHYLTSVDVTT